VTVRIVIRSTALVITSDDGIPIIGTVTVVGRTWEILNEFARTRRSCLIFLRNCLWTLCGSVALNCQRSDRRGLPDFVRIIMWPHRPGKDGLYAADDLERIMRVPLDDDGVRRIDRLFRLEDDHYVEFDPMMRGKAVNCPRLKPWAS